MRRYELMLIVDGKLEEKDVPAAVDKHLDIVRERGGNVIKVDHWGKRRFVYEIRHMNEGFYAVVDFETTPEVLAELDRVLSLADEVVRFKVLRPVP
ncbi:MAG: 30S ribosomal protein S6 [Actinomycetota bacterium]|jgi:small subunit ribosomal protein S6